MEGTPSKVGALFSEGGSTGARAYRALCYGDMPWWRALYAETVIALVGGMPGAAGLWLRSKLFRPLFAAVGRGVIFGRNITLRHPHKISIGERVIIDDNAVLDAKGEDNRGILLGDRVFVGRNTILYCKNGDIELERGVSVSSNCQLFSSRRLSIGAQTVVGSFSYLLSGGEYDPASPIPFGEQEGKPERLELRIGPNCWIGANVTVIETARVGEHCVLGAGAVVTGEIPPNSLAVGIPARVTKPL